MSDRQADHVVFLCTGNAARSVMATIMFRARTEGFEVSGAGTHVVEGHPMSVRTRRALERHGLADRSHRSRQLWRDHATGATVIVAMAPEHVEWVRRTHPMVAARTATIKRLVRDLPAARGVDLAQRLATLGLADIELEPWEEVVDPAAGEQPEFDACADELDALVDGLIAALRAPA